MKQRDAYCTNSVPWVGICPVLWVEFGLLILTVVLEDGKVV